ncbi:hypothetical protein NQ318_018715 [Aromia moschata]|uniref:DUF4817 domain-containing protein n=1 Tax=Aromia moschata TaxID=1265417 RepID=A0AAV8ZFF0_9CUCU|nr:hypothetical protein NQ318_018715 [Aromia moschata]
MAVNFIVGCVTIYWCGCGDKTRTQKQVCEIFNTKYPDRCISQSTVSRIENKFREFGNVTDIPKFGRKRILDDERKLDILLDIQDNPRVAVTPRGLEGSVTNPLDARSLSPTPLVSDRGAGVDTRNTKKRHDDHASVQYEKANAYCYCLPLHN